MESVTTYTTTESHETQKPAVNPALVALASVGFITLIALGILLAIYSSRYVPDAITKLFSSWTSGNTGNPQLNVVSTSTISFGQETGGSDSSTSTVATVTTSPLSTDTTTGSPATTATPTQTTAPTQTTTKKAPALYGLGNLSVTILATGYLADGTTESFVPSNVIPVGARAAVRFSIANTGTNVTGPWNFAAAIPTQNVYVFTSPTEQSMHPGDHIVFTLGFDQADFGANHPLTIIADPANVVNEETKADNTATAVINVQ